jgi:hypothetical protein
MSAFERGFLAGWFFGGDGGGNRRPSGDSSGFLGIIIGILFLLVLIVTLVELIFQFISNIIVGLGGFLFKIYETLPELAHYILYPATFDLFHGLGEGKPFIKLLLMIVAVVIIYFLSTQIYKILPSRINTVIQGFLLIHFMLLVVRVIYYIVISVTALFFGYDELQVKYEADFVGEDVVQISTDENVRDNFVAFSESKWWWFDERIHDSDGRSYTKYIRFRNGYEVTYTMDPIQKGEATWTYIEIPLDNNYLFFDAKAGIIEDFKDSSAETTFIFRLDDMQEDLQTIELSKGVQPIDIHLNVAGAQSLKIWVTTTQLEERKIEVALFDPTLYRER